MKLTTPAIAKPEMASSAKAARPRTLPREAYKPNPPPRLAFFFGAGAEVAYGMPAGGRFALDIFRHDFEQARDIFKAQRDSLERTLYYDWLPEPLPSSIYKFGKNEWSKIFEETLDSNRENIAKNIGSIDDYADDLLEQCGLEPAAFAASFRAATGTTFGTRLYGEAIAFQSQLGSTALFNSRYFSAALDLCKSLPDERSKQLVNSIVRLLSGALGQDLVRELNQNVFARRPEDLDVLDAGELFSVNLVEAGEAAFNEVFNARPQQLKPDDDVQLMMSALLTAALERIVEANISYQRLMDEYYPSLFKPKGEYAKFVRISVFLHGVNQYILNKQDECAARFDAGDGYYHDVANAIATHAIDVSAIGTSNYTSFLERAVPDSEPYYLNGSLVDYLDPYRNRIVQANQLATARRFFVP